MISFYNIKLSCPKSTKVGFSQFSVLINDLIDGNVVNGQTLENIPNLLDVASKDDLVVLHIGGDSSNKKSLTGVGENFTNGIYAVGKIQSLDLAGKKVSLDLYPIERVCTKLELYPFPQFINNLGVATKGIPNQAGLYRLEQSIAQSFFEYLTLEGILGKAAIIVSSILSKGYLLKGMKDFYADKSLTTKEVLVDMSNDFGIPSREASEHEEAPKKEIKDQAPPFKNFLVDYIEKEDS